MGDREVERRKDRSEVRVEAVHKLLESASRSGELDLLVLADEKGGFVAKGGDGKAHDPNKIAAFGGHLIEIRKLLGRSMDIHDIDQVRLIRKFDRLVVCRYFEFGSATLVLIVLASSPAADVASLDGVVDSTQRILRAEDLSLDD